MPQVEADILSAKDAISRAEVLPARKAKYGFNDKLWNVFMAEESRFVSSIRRINENKSFYDRLGVDFYLKAVR